MFELFALLLAAVGAARRRRGDLIAENLLLRPAPAGGAHPPHASATARPLRRPDTLLWVLVRRLRRDGRRHLVVVTPDTVVRWHRAGWRLYWRWRPRSPGGRPRLSPEVRDLIARMSEANPLWGSERIRGELLKLGIVVSHRSIWRYRWRPPGRPLSQTWRTFVRKHAHAIWAADLCVVQTLAFETLNVLVFIAHGRRELVYLAVTAHPTAAWVWRRPVEATAWGRRPEYLRCDRDRVFGGAFRERPTPDPSVRSVAEHSGHHASRPRGGKNWGGESPEYPHQFGAASARRQEGPAASLGADPTLIVPFVGGLGRRGGGAPQLERSSNDYRAEHQRALGLCGAGLTCMWSSEHDEG